MVQLERGGSEGTAAAFGTELLGDGEVADLDGWTVVVWPVRNTARALDR